MKRHSTFMGLGTLSLLIVWLILPRILELIGISKNEQIAFSSVWMALIGFSIYLTYLIQFDLMKVKVKLFGFNKIHGFILLVLTFVFLSQFTMGKLVFQESKKINLVLAVSSALFTAILIANVKKQKN